MKTLLGIPITKLDRIKYMRQLRCVARWKKSTRGTIEAATGFGKTWIAHITLKKMLKLNSTRTAIVIVPTTQLKEQWEDEINKLKMSNNVKVYVVNTIALNTVTYHCNLLIVDEIHMMAADKFKRIFELVKYNWILGLTATINRLDGKHEYLKKVAPVVDSISQKEAISRGWISNFIEINIAVPLSRKEQEHIDSLAKTVRFYMAKFGDFKLMQSCMNLGNAKAFAQKQYPNEDANIKAKQIALWAVQGSRAIQQRQEFLYKTERKIALTVDLLKEFDLKTITFSQSTFFADEVAKQMGEKAVVYHSNIETQVISEEKIKVFKKKPTAEKFAKEVDGTIGIDFEADEFIVTYKKDVKYGAEKLKQLGIKKFRDKRTKVNIICTAKALDQGFDEKDVELGIDGSRTSNPTQHVQRTGRVARNYTYKDGTKKRGIYINLFCPNTRDEEWLRTCQKNSTEVVWFHDSDEAISFIKTILENEKDQPSSIELT